MNRKAVLKPYTLLNAVTLGSAQLSSAVEVTYMDRVAFSLVATGTPAGTLTIEWSPDYDGTSAATIAASTWVDYGVAAMALAGAGATFAREIQQTASRAFRVRYAFTSGTGTLTVKVSAKASG